MASALLSLALAAVPLSLISSMGAPPPPQCATLLDAWCGNESNPVLKVDYASLRKHRSTVPMVAALSGGKGGGADAWRCYSPDNLLPKAPLLARKYYCPASGPGSACGDYASEAGPYLASILRKCDPSWQPPDPPGLVRVKVLDGAIPTLTYLPPSHIFGNGTLIAAGQSGPGGLLLRRSDDLGETWGELLDPTSGGLFPPFKTKQILEQPQLGYDVKNDGVFLFFTIIDATPHGGGCDFGVLNELGFWMAESQDRGLTWSPPVDVQRTLPNKPDLNNSRCVAPTNGAGIQLGPQGPHTGRLVFSGQSDSYNGSVAVFSDDGGVTWDWTSSLHKPGMDECSIAQLSNGSLFAIMRSCPASQHGQCEGRRRLQADESAEVTVAVINRTAGEWLESHVGGDGNSLFSYAVSDDGGNTFGPIRLHPDLVTPVCMSSLFAHKSGALLFSGPYSTTSRFNLTVLASLDNGQTFTRSLRVTAGPSGYSAMQCGLPGREDCGILYDAMSGAGLMFSRFAFEDLQPF